jgi:hypothetical protein
VAKPALGSVDLGAAPPETGTVMNQQTAFAYIECDIAAGLTLREYRRKRRRPGRRRALINVLRAAYRPSR